VLEFFFKLLLLACAWKWKYFIIANIKSDPFQCGMEDDEDVFLIRKKMGVCLEISILILVILVLIFIFRVVKER